MHNKLLIRYRHGQCAVAIRLNDYFTTSGRITA